MNTLLKCYDTVPNKNGCIRFELSLLFFIRTNHIIRTLEHAENTTSKRENYVLFDERFIAFIRHLSDYFTLHRSDQATL